LSDNPYRLTRAEVVVANGVAGEVARTRCTTREEKKAAHRGFLYVQLEPLAQTAGEETSRLTCIVTGCGQRAD